MLTIRHEKPSDAAAREALLDAAYGPSRFEKPSQRLRAGRNAADGLSLVAVDDGRVVGTVRLWTVSAGPDCPALLLGPLAVDPERRRRGIGAALMRRALHEAQRRGHRAVLLVGDTSYYGRFGFAAARTGKLWLPGLDAQHRLLGCELRPGALGDARGRIGIPQPVPSRRAAARRGHSLAPQAA
jgi:predicted N-acetyltransferase YhbS